MCKFFTFENSTISEKNSACNECVRFPEENLSVTSRTPVQTEAPWPIKVEPRNGQMSGKSYLESVQKFQNDQRYCSLTPPPRGKI